MSDKTYAYAVNTHPHTHTHTHAPGDISYLRRAPRNGMETFLVTAAAVLEFCFRIILDVDSRQWHSLSCEILNETNCVSVFKMSSLHRCHDVTLSWLLCVLVNAKIKFYLQKLNNKFQVAGVEHLFAAYDRRNYVPLLLFYFCTVCEFEC